MAASAERSAASLVYLYGFVEHGAEPGPVLEGLEGLTLGGAVRLVSGGTIAGIVSDVPAAEFSGDRLAENMNRMPWLEATARAHSEVLGSLGADATVLPARLATIYRTDDAVREAIEEERAALERAFARLRGHREWGVKVYVDRSRLTQVMEAREPIRVALAGSDEPSGSAYLARRKRERAVEDRVRDEVARLTREVHEALLRSAAEARRVDARAELPGDEGGELAFSAAYLVPREGEESFQEAAAELRRAFEDRGVVVFPSGPWPPYNFLEKAGA